MIHEIKLVVDRNDQISLSRSDHNDYRVEGARVPIGDLIICIEFSRIWGTSEGFSPLARIQRFPWLLPSDGFAAEITEWFRKPKSALPRLLNSEIVVNMRDAVFAILAKEQALFPALCRARIGVSDQTFNNGPEEWGHDIALVLSLSKDAKKYDAFISHASEDKDGLVRPLAEGLRQRGLEIWYDEFTLLPGDSLRRSIDRGLADSRFGVVVLSANFLNKGWPQYELDGLTALRVEGNSVLVPVWHGVSKQDVLAFSPPLADLVAVRTSDMDLPNMIDKLSRALCRNR